MISEKLQNLRSGPVFRAGYVNDSNVRNWLSLNGLNLGVRLGGETSHRRYDLVDAAKLLLLSFLTDRLRMPAQPAVDIANAAHSTLTLLAMHEYFAVDYPAAAQNADEYVMLIDRVDGSTLPTIALAAELGSYQPILQTRVGLNALVRLAMDNLLSQVGASPVAVREMIKEGSSGTPMPELAHAC